MSVVVKTLVEDIASSQIPSLSVVVDCVDQHFPATVISQWHDEIDKRVRRMESDVSGLGTLFRVGTCPSKAKIEKACALVRSSTVAFVDAVIKISQYSGMNFQKPLLDKSVQVLVVIWGFLRVIYEILLTSEKEQTAGSSTDGDGDGDDGQDEGDEEGLDGEGDDPGDDDVFLNFDPAVIHGHLEKIKDASEDMENVTLSWVESFSDLRNELLEEVQDLLSSLPEPGEDESDDVRACACAVAVDQSQTLLEKTEDVASRLFEIDLESLKYDGEHSAEKLDEFFSNTCLHVKELANSCRSVSTALESLCNCEDKTNDVMPSSFPPLCANIERYIQAIAGQMSCVNVDISFDDIVDDCHKIVALFWQSALSLH